MNPDSSKTIPEWIHRWFADAQHGLGMQDWDLVLMEREYLPLMFAYLESPDGILEKKYTIVSALAEMLLMEQPEDAQTVALSESDANAVIALIRKNNDLALKACDDLGVRAAMLIKMIVGCVSPEEISQWPGVAEECQRALSRNF